MFCGCWLPNLLFLLLCETLLSNDFPTNLKHPFYFRKFKIMTKVFFFFFFFFVMKRKINQCVYLVSLRLKLSSFHWGKYFFCHQIPIPRFTKTFFTAVSELCKDTPGAHCTILWENKSGESVLWVLTAISVGTLERLLLNDNMWDSWPPEETNSIWGQKRGWIAQSFCVIKSFIKV